MADDDQNAPPSTPANPTVAPATQPTPAAPAPRMFTEAEVQQAVNSAAAAARREAEAKKREPAPAAPRPEPAPTTGVSAADIARIVAQETAFTLAAERSKLNEDQVSMLRAKFDKDAPPNVNEWLDRNVKLFGGGNVSTPVNPAAPANPQAAAPTTPSVPAPIAPSAPSTAVPMERDVDIFTMDPSAIHELMRKKGASNPSRPYDPKNRAGRREIRREFEAALMSRRVKLGSK